MASLLLEVGVGFRRGRIGLGKAVAGRGSRFGTARCPANVQRLGCLYAPPLFRYATLDIIRAFQPFRLHLLEQLRRSFS